MTGDTAQAVEEGPIRNKADIASVLADCCERALPCKIVAHASIFKGRFSAVTDQHVDFELFDIPTERIDSGAACCMTYVHNNRPCIFLAVADGIERRDKLPMLRISLPKLIDGPERREALRVPVDPDSGVQLRLMIEGREPLTPEVLDLSRGGMMVEITAEGDPVLAHGTRCTVELQHGEQTVGIVAEVCRCSGGQYGFSFRETVDRQAISYSESLRVILGELEQRWIERRRRSWMMMFGRHPIPVIEGHKQAVCVHCKHTLANCRRTDNQTGFGQFIGSCHACNLYTWYDLRRG